MEALQSTARKQFGISRDKGVRNVSVRPPAK